ncbi:MAG TPA: octaprenyl diphosphate synthase [Armatimonadetes bacterium]|nr:octaprenyl diphosphate synthase [Armatimonadota bacterium]
MSAFLKGPLPQHLVDEIGQELRCVEEALAQEVRSQVPLVSEVGLHTLRAGGKRMRPAFVALAARGTGLPFDPARARKIGAAVELIHMATLIHDDVVDHAGLRRGVQTANALFGNTASILAGDVLLAKAMRIFAEDGDPKIIHTMSVAVAELAEGEVAELSARNVFDLSLPEYLEIVRLKTASFIRGCCTAGALIAGAPQETVEALARYGEAVGIAFQIVDDLLDYRGDKAKTGKPVATDFREGCATLPLILLRDRLSDGERDVARRKFGNGVSDDEVRMLCNWMESRGCFDETVRTAQEYVARAVGALERLPKSDGADLLRTLARMVLERES